MAKRKTPPLHVNQLYRHPPKGDRYLDLSPKHPARSRRRVAPCKDCGLTVHPRRFVDEARTAPFCPLGPDAPPGARETWLLAQVRTLTRRVESLETDVADLLGAHLASRRAHQAAILDGGAL